MSRVIELKCWPEPFSAIKRGDKTFEARLNDRGFMVGDTLHLQEYDPNESAKQYGMSRAGYTGKTIDVLVTYIMHGGKFGINSAHCVMSIKRIEASNEYR